MNLRARFQIFLSIQALIERYLVIWPDQLSYCNICVRKIVYVR